MDDQKELKKRYSLGHIWNEMASFFVIKNLTVIAAIGFMATVSLGFLSYDNKDVYFLSDIQSFLLFVFLIVLMVGFYELCKYFYQLMKSNRKLLEKGQIKDGWLGSEFLFFSKVIILALFLCFILSITYLFWKVLLTSIFMKFIILVILIFVILWILACPLFKISLDWLSRLSRKKDVNKKRNPIVSLQFSLLNTKDFFKTLCEMDTKTELMSNSSINEQEWKSFMIVRRALWIALVVEISRLFDTYNKKNTKNISLKQTAPFNSVFKNKIDRIHGHAIIGKIIKLRKTFTTHLGEDEKDFLSIKEICSSDLGKLLNELDMLMKQVDKITKVET